MSKKVRYEENPFGEDVEVGPVLPDFLPKPWELADMEKKTRVTITLNESSVAFFKQQAKKYKTPYQAMIRNLLQAYVARAKE